MGISVLNEQLYDAIINKGDVQSVEDALAQGADANGSDNWKGFDDYCQSPLMEACGNRNNFSLPIVKLLLENGARVNDKDFWDETPLMKLGKSENCSERALNLLLDAGADINATGGDEGVTFLMYAAASYLTPGVLELAVERGADINQRDKRGRTALLVASDRGFIFTPDLVNAFIRCKADFDACDKKGRGLSAYINGIAALKLYIHFSERGDEEMALRFYDIVKARSGDTPLPLVRLALMYPETNKELEKEMRVKQFAAFRRLLFNVPDVSASFWSNVLNIISTKGRRIPIHIEQNLTGNMVKVLSAVLEHSPGTAINFISTKLGADVLKEWENGGVEGSGKLNERLSTILRELVEDRAASFGAGYVL